MSIRAGTLLPIILLVTVAGCLDQGTGCGPTNTAYPGGGGQAIYCGMTFEIRPIGGIIDVTTQATKHLEWRQLELRGGADVRTAINGNPSLNSTSLPTNLGEIQSGRIEAGDQIRLCGAGPTDIALTDAGWPYAAFRFRVDLPPCA